MKTFQKLKPGDTITCIVEERIKNCLLVRYECKNGRENSTIFRGVLMDKNNPSIQRLIPPLSPKPVLTEEAVDLFIESFHSSHISGKFLRNKNKPSCLILDEFHQNTNCGLGQQIVVDIELENSCKRDRFVDGSRRSKFSIDKLCMKTNTNSQQLSVAKKTERVPRKPKKTIKIIKEISQIKVKEERDNSIEKEEMELQSPIEFFGKELLDSCEVSQANNDSSSESDDNDKTLLPECHEDRKRDLDHLSLKSVTEMYNGEATERKSYSSPRKHLKRHINDKDDRSCTEKCEIKTGTKRARTITTKFKDYQNDEKKRQRKNPACSTKKASKLSLSSQRKYGPRKSSENKKENLNDKDNDTPVSLYCDEPALDYVTDEEDEIDMLKKKEVAAAKRKQAEKILKGKISRLVHGSTNRLQGQEQCTKSQRNTMQLWCILPEGIAQLHPAIDVSMDNLTMSDANTKKTEKVSASMPEARDCMLIEPCSQKEKLQKPNDCDSEFNVKNQNPSTKSIAKKASITTKEQTRCTRNNLVFIEKSQEQNNVKDEAKDIEKKKLSSKSKKKDMSQTNDTIKTKNIDDSYKESDRIPMKGKSFKKDVKETKNLIKLESEETDNERFRDVGEDKGLFEKSLITKCLENFNSESVQNRKGIKTQGSGISNRCPKSSSLRDKQRRIIDPFAYSKISFQRLIDSARNEIRKESTQTGFSTSESTNNEDRRMEGKRKDLYLFENILQEGTQSKENVLTALSSERSVARLGAIEGLSGENSTEEAYKSQYKGTIYENASKKASNGDKSKRVSVANTPKHVSIADASVRVSTADAYKEVSVNGVYNTAFVTEAFKRASIANTSIQACVADSSVRVPTAGASRRASITDALKTTTITDAPKIAYIADAPKIASIIDASKRVPPDASKTASVAKTCVQLSTAVAPERVVKVEPSNYEVSEEKLASNNHALSSYSAGGPICVAKSVHCSSREKGTSCKKALTINLPDQSTNATITTNNTSVASFSSGLSVGEIPVESTSDDASFSITPSVCNMFDNHTSVITDKSSEDIYKSQYDVVADLRLNIKESKMCKPKAKSHRGENRCKVLVLQGKKHPSDSDSACKNDLALHVALKNTKFEDILRIKTENRNNSFKNNGLALCVALRNLKRLPICTGLNFDGKHESMHSDRRSVNETGTKLHKKHPVSKIRKNIFKLRNSRDLKPSSMSRSGIKNIEKKLTEGETGSLNDTYVEQRLTEMNTSSGLRECKTTTPKEGPFPTVGLYEMSHDYSKDIPEYSTSSTCNPDYGARNLSLQNSEASSDQSNTASASEPNPHKQLPSNQTFATEMQSLPGSVVIKKEPIDIIEVGQQLQPLLCDDSKEQIVGGKTFVDTAGYCLNRSSAGHSLNDKEKKKPAVTKTVVFKTQQKLVKYPRVFQKPESRRKISSSYNDVGNSSNDEKSTYQRTETISQNAACDRGKELVEQMLRLNQNILSHRNDILLCNKDQK